MIGLLITIIILGVIIFVHELGHLFMARQSNVYCPEFSIGFGKTLWRKKGEKSQTTYMIKAIPLGGYVQMADREYEGEIPAGMSNYESTAKYKKALILFAGSFMNFLLAFVIFFGIGVAMGYPSTQPIIGQVIPETAAARAGLKANDRILEIDSKPIQTFDQISESIASDKTSKFVIFRPAENKTLTIDVKPDAVAVGQGITLPVLGISTAVDYGIGGAIINGFTRLVGTLEMTLFAIFALITGQIGLDSLTGPIGLISITGTIANQAGTIGAVILTLASFLALISANIGLINLFPLPVLDGGRLLLLLIEAIRRKPLPEKIENFVLIGSAILLIGLMLLITVNDLLRF